MRKYEVISNFGADHPVGSIIETDNLHPSLEQHVRALGPSGKTAAVEEVASDTDKDKGVEVPTTSKPAKAAAKPDAKAKAADDDNT